MAAMADLDALHPVLVGLLYLLPPYGRPFPAAARARWLEAFAYALAEVYPVPPEDERQERHDAQRQEGE
jgi:hypothetical protein